MQYAAKKMYIHKTKLSKFKYFQVYSAHWRMHKYLLKYKVRFFLNNFLSFIKKELKDEEVISINKASWVIDQKSYKYMHWFSDSLQSRTVPTHPRTYRSGKILVPFHLCYVFFVKLWQVQAISPWWIFLKAPTTNG